MGGSSTKFKKHLQRGDEYAAMRMYSNSLELKNLDPNLSCGENHNNNTLLHYAAKHGMKHLLRAFLNEHNGNPNKKNNSNETALHAVCYLSPQSSYSAHERRAACVTLLLNWQGAEIADGRREKIQLCAQNNDGNTALHLATSSGLQYCVDLMLAHGGAPIFKTNKQNLTACDLAVNNGHETLARKLESRMVFGEDLKDVLTVVDEYDFGEEDTYAGLRTQDLQEAKDQLLVETADMLNLPLFTAEALLKNNEWSREILLERWVRDPDKCCQIAGVQVPISVQSSKKIYFNGIQQTQTTLEEAQRSVNDEIICDICLNELPFSDCPIKLCCDHKFCNSCWKQYLTYKIKRKDSSNIFCPALHCHILVPTELIENIVSPEMARRYFDLNIEAFVESNRSIKWCPVPNCGLAVRLPINTKKTKNNLKIAHSVDCGRGHYFCWECMGDAHTPCSCQQWSQWMTKISEVKPDKIRETTVEYEEAANSLWLVTNSKPCPNCHSPIQKNEGCNHMRCSKCKFEFCWVCQESWKKHGSATGGFFRCNRASAVCKADEKRGLLLKEAQHKNKQSLELSKFLHYYTKFKKHEVTRQMEECYVKIVKKWRTALANALNIPDDDERTKFVEDAVVEVQKSKRVLCASYVYGFYMQSSAYNRNILEFMQNEVEEVTEKLAGMVLRQYICNPRSAIINTTSVLRRKRHEFINAISDGSISLESMQSAPQNITNTKNKSSLLQQKHSTSSAMDLMKKAIGDSIQIDPDNPWIVDSNGRHRNLTAILDWPESCSDEEEETELDRALAVSVFGQCKMEQCNKARVRNPRTSKFHEYCSLRCKNSHKTLLEEEKKEKRTSIVGTFAMDLIVALEMSRLQMIKDAQQRKKSKIEDNASCSKDPDVLEDSIDDDQQIQMALQMSLDEISLAKTKDLSKSESETVTVSSKTSRETANDLKNIPRLIPKCSGIKLDDGVFKVGDLHKNSYYLDFSRGIYNRLESTSLRRSLSFGDLISRRDLYKNNRRYCVNVYHLSSDDGHDQITKDNVRLKYDFQVLPKKKTSIFMEIDCNGKFQSVTSLDDSNIAAPISSDKELCSVLAQIACHNPKNFRSTSFKHLSKIGKTAAVDQPDETLEKESYSKAEVPPKPNLSIKIEKFSSHSEDSADNDVSADFESDTGIPKSPTLFISGVSINRTPESKSPISGRQSRSASLTVPKYFLKPLYKGTSADNLTSCRECNVVHTNKAHSYQTLFSADRMCSSANMVDKTRNIFTFPKSLTDGELFSTLHIDRNELSSDDFHEGLFLGKKHRHF
ncbi:ankyrin repeat and IBR domain-containing protein 1-like [Adelges cooleyi]|uniref:ankyrin repeat and IBR domain-containing protein 1-like n=1 Tax=Adelges cooleyi TaxID=133065 RepID=UPI00218055DD|nr:ankyrin repeat and IBR domain-containing protein 1-like [Adelges cooleyi]